MKVEDSLSLEFEKNHFHPIIEYLSTIEWDGGGEIGFPY